MSSSKWRHMNNGVSRLRQQNRKNRFRKSPAGRAGKANEVDRANNNNQNNHNEHHSPDRANQIIDNNENDTARDNNNNDDNNNNNNNTVTGLAANASLVPERDRRFTPSISRSRQLRGGVPSTRRKRQELSRSKMRPNLHDDEEEIDIDVAGSPNDTKDGVHAKGSASKLLKDARISSPKPRALASAFDDAVEETGVGTAHSSPSSKGDSWRRSSCDSEDVDTKSSAESDHDSPSPSDGSDSEEEMEFPVYLLTELEMLVDDIKPGAYVALDIDETLIRTAGSPSLLMTNRGVQEFTRFVHKAYSEWSVKNSHCRSLQKALKRKILVTETTARVIKTLQEKGCHVFGLTARYSEMSTETTRTLQNLGISFAATTPFQDTSVHANACADSGDYYGVEALCKAGIIYCNSKPKGRSLVALLEQQQACAISDTEQTNKNLLTNDLPTKPLPPEIVFVDDLYDNAQDISSQLAPWGQTRGIVVNCYHYVPMCLAELQQAHDPDYALREPPIAATIDTVTDCNASNALLREDTQASDDKLYWQVLLKQITTFLVSSGETVLSNQEAKDVL